MRAAIGMIASHSWWSGVSTERLGFASASAQANREAKVIIACSMRVFKWAEVTSKVNGSSALTRQTACIKRSSTLVHKTSVAR